MSLDCVQVGQKEHSRGTRYVMRWVRMQERRKNVISYVRGAR